MPAAFTLQLSAIHTPRNLARAANLGVISAVFFRERGQPVTVTQAQPKPVYGRETTRSTNDRRRITTRASWYC